ncbi:hypothetical protein PCH_Pc18g04880 [Penicillium rubens Wisconsin 54-1255]|uniref:Uncharacterized protein n=1 Tax=Penicillium rubens (strain ATCC 28089 / DSM 1075 / NRRL 1951 / Wisconsin 54-1255) TaxID=500485 RepID=B6HBW0_PENRW|nr:hypothetical protein PCH_Pc18g04880 [Penicillium rubens Wisconsin 54-1255]
MGRDLEDIPPTVGTLRQTRSSVGDRAANPVSISTVDYNIETLNPLRERGSVGREPGNDGIVFRGLCRVPLKYLGTWRTGVHRALTKRSFIRLETLSALIKAAAAKIIAT